jgi:hypothetical protein
MRFSPLIALCLAFSIAVSAQTGGRGPKLPNGSRSSSSSSTGRPKADRGILSASSTVIFEESFEGSTGFPPAGWKMADLDGGGTTGPWFQGNTSIFSAYSGTGYAAANYQGANDFLIDDWLISPRIVSTTSFDTLTFWERSPDNSVWDDSLEIRISTTDTATISFTIRLDYFKTSTAGWEQKHYPLKNFVPAGSSIYIAFRYLLTNAGVSGTSSDYVGLDLVQITRPAAQKDIRVASIDFPIGGSKILLNQTIQPLATFQNSGMTTQRLIPTRVRIYPPQGSPQEADQTIDSLTPGEVRQLAFDNFTPTLPGVYTIRAYSLLSGDQIPSNDSLQIQTRGALLLTGTITVGAGGDAATLKQALDSLNNNIIAGDITLSLIDQLYSEPPLVIGPLDYSSTPNQVLLKPAPGVSPTVNVASTGGEPYGLAIKGASYVTLNGSSADIDRRDLTINAATANGKIGIFIQGTEGANADSNTVKNVKIRTGADSLASSDGFYGVLLSGYRSDIPGSGNRIANCDITRHGSAGISLQWQDGARLEQNYIHDWAQLGGSTELWGIWLADGAVNTTVAGNTIGNIKNRVNYNWVSGIENGSGTRSSALVCNNMMYGVLSSGAGLNANYSRAIYSSNTANSGDAYCFNSVYLSGTDSSTSASSRTAGFECSGGSDITFLDNIIYNAASLAGGSPDNKAYGVYLATAPSGFVSNNNDLFTPGAQGAVGYNAGNRLTLTDWRSSFSPSRDSLSMSADPLFVSAPSGNLHIQTAVTSPVNNSGKPFPGVAKDIDGSARNPVAPDIGADEFTPGAASVQVSYTEGWNLVSVPLSVTDYRRTSLFPGSSSDAFSFNGTYTPESLMTTGPGYWLKFGSAQVNEIGGSPVVADTLPVIAGWNLIGSVTDAVPTSAILQVPPGILETGYYAFDGSYYETSVLEPGRGYWVKVKQSGMLILNSTEAAR